MNDAPTTDAATAVAEPPTGGTNASQTAGDFRSRQQAVLLAYARRDPADTDLENLLANAETLLAETLKVDLSGIALPASQGGFNLTVTASGNAGIEAEGNYHYSTSDTWWGGTALGSRQVVVCGNAAEQTQLADKHLAQMGVQSGIVLPLQSGSAVYGVLGLYCLQPREFSADESAFAELLVRLLVERIAKSELKQSNQAELDLCQSVLTAVGTSVLQVNADGHVSAMNPAAQSASGFEAAELAQQPFWTALIATDQHEAMSQAQRQALDGKPASVEAVLVSKSGDRSRVEWRAVPSAQADANVAILWTGSNVTARELAESRAAAAEQKVAQLRKALADLVAMNQADRNRSANQVAVRRAAAQPLPQLSERALSVVDDESAHRRQSERRTYHFRQKMAPLVEGRMPSPDDFYQVPFRDLSAGGACYLVDSAPAYEAVIIELGTGENVNYISADVVRVEPIEHNGRTYYSVGCKFTGRVQL